MLKFNPAPMPIGDLRALLGYDPDTGQFWWRRDRKNHIRANFATGYITSNGYVIIKIEGRDYKAHRLAWYLVTGVWPEEFIDHKNMIKGDNRIENLRLATKAQNGGNTPSRRPASGYRGVYRIGNRWIAKLRTNNRLEYLGIFKTPEEAYAAFCAYTQATRGEFARTD